MPVSSPGATTAVATSTPSARRVRSTSAPSSSSPTRPVQRTLWPSRATPIATLDSAPATESRRSPPSRSGRSAAQRGHRLAQGEQVDGHRPAPFGSGAAEGRRWPWGGCRRRPASARARSRRATRLPPSAESPVNGEPTPTAVAPRGEVRRYGLGGHPADRHQRHVGEGRSQRAQVGRPAQVRGGEELHRGRPQLDRGHHLRRCQRADQHGHAEPNALPGARR